MAEHDASHRASHRGFSPEEAEDVEDKLRLRAPVIYEIVRQEGEEEMRRPLASLWWSGIAAGLSIGFSLVAQAILYHHLPDAGWRPLVADLGYTVGFVIVILGRQQLFTENTITPILPLVADFNRRTLWCVARLWGVVFAANMVGTFGFALFNALLPGTNAEVMGAMLELSRHALDKSWFDQFVFGIGAGFLIAVIVWLLPSAGGTKLLVILLFTYLIAIADFSHIIVGSVEAFLLVLTGEIGMLEMVWRFTVPVLIGNIIGGSALFALLAYAQVKEEIET